MGSLADRIGTSQQQPYASAKTAPVEVVMTVGAVLRQVWGDYGYSYGVEAAGLGSYLFACRHSDGSEWFLWADRYGNVHETNWTDGEFKKGERL